MAIESREMEWCVASDGAAKAQCVGAALPGEGGEVGGPPGGRFEVMEVSKLLFAGNVAF